MLDGQDEVLATWITNQLTRVRNASAGPAKAPSAKPAGSGVVSLWDMPSGAVRPYPDLYFEDRRIGVSKMNKSIIWEAAILVWKLFFLRAV